MHKTDHLVCCATFNMCVETEFAFWSLTLAFMDA